jgi:hypothetical protein
MYLYSYTLERRNEERKAMLKGETQKTQSEVVVRFARFFAGLSFLHHVHTVEYSRKFLSQHASISKFSIKEVAVVSGFTWFIVMS